MRNYLAIILSAAALVFGADPAAADADQHGYGDGHGHHRMGGGFRDPARMVERMARHLDLDDTQRQNIGNIVEAAKPELDALRERARANWQAMQALDPADPDYSAKLNNLAIENGELVADGTVLFGRIRADVSNELTPEQREEFAAMVSERRKRFGHGRRGPGRDESH